MSNERKVIVAEKKGENGKDPKNFIPQRFPFLLIDRIVDETEKTLTGIKNVSENEAFFVGHFPEQPVMPGVLILESLAQAAGVLLSKIAKDKSKVWAMKGSDRMRFRKPVVPGDQLILEVELVDWNGTVGKFKGTAKVSDQVAASGDLEIALENA